MFGKNFSQRFKELRKEMHLSQAKIAEDFDLSQATIASWENGTRSPLVEMMPQIANYFHTTVDYLLGITDNAPVPAIQIVRNAVPIIGEIACGVPILAQENIDGYADLPEGIRADFALRCKGDSMEPTFKDGDLVLIRRQLEVETGQIAAVGINGEATLKHVYKYDDHITLTAENPLYAPITVPFTSDNEIVIYGLAIGYTRLF